MDVLEQPNAFVTGGQVRRGRDQDPDLSPRGGRPLSHAGVQP